MIPRFKAGVVPIVIASSVAARGLDVKQLELVVDYHAPNHLKVYVHRAGRTGRGGNKGMCVTFITPEQERYSVNIYRALKANSETTCTILAVLSRFLDKLKTGKAQGADSGFDGKGVDRLDNERDTKDKVERKTYDEPEEEKTAVTEEAAPGGTTPNATAGQYDFRKPQSAATTSRKLAHTKEEQKIQNQIRAAEEAAASACKESTAHKQAFSVVANSTHS
ncbi:P-loop containing nucleoside triphosphate hydrolase protein [Lentinula novae-zelandiae]|nr:P-loop containing nucleoside triphosphate hydrolase protein [Lentinula novae-zelandiae]